MTQNSSEVTAGTNGTAPQYNNLRRDLMLGVKTIIDDSYASTTTFDFDPTISENSNIRRVTMTGNPTLAVTNEQIGQIYHLILVQDGTGSRVPTWWANIKWPAGVAPTLTTTAGAIDVISFMKTGASEYLGFLSGFDFS